MPTTSSVAVPGCEAPPNTATITLAANSPATSTRRFSTAVRMGIRVQRRRGRQRYAMSPTSSVAVPGCEAPPNTATITLAANSPATSTRRFSTAVRMGIRVQRRRGRQRYAMSTTSSVAVPGCEAPPNTATITLAANSPATSTRRFSTAVRMGIRVQRRRGRQRYAMSTTSSVAVPGCEAPPNTATITRAANSPATSTRRFSTAVRMGSGFNAAEDGNATRISTTSSVAVPGCEAPPFVRDRHLLATSCAILHPQVRRGCHGRVRSPDHRGNCV